MLKAWLKKRERNKWVKQHEINKARERGIHYVIENIEDWDPKIWVSRQAVEEIAKTAPLTTKRKCDLFGHPPWQMFKTEPEYAFAVMCSSIAGHGFQNLMLNNLDLGQFLENLNAGLEI